MSRRWHKLLRWRMLSGVYNNNWGIPHILISKKIQCQAKSILRIIQRHNRNSSQLLVSSVDIKHPKYVSKFDIGMSSCVQIPGLNSDSSGLWSRYLARYLGCCVTISSASWRTKWASTDQAPILLHWARNLIVNMKLWDRGLSLYFL